MPIKIPGNPPACRTREAEDAVHHDIRPLRIGLLNLMPNKIRTEIQVARLIGAPPLQVELTLVKKHTDSGSGISDRTRCGPRDDKSIEAAGADLIPRAG